MTYGYGKVTIQSISILCKDRGVVFWGLFRNHPRALQKTSEQWLLNQFVFVLRWEHAGFSQVHFKFSSLFFCFDLRMESIIELGCAYNAGLFCAALLVWCGMFCWCFIVLIWFVLVGVERVFAHILLGACLLKKWVLLRNSYVCDVCP